MIKSWPISVTSTYWPKTKLVSQTPIPSHGGQRLTLRIVSPSSENCLVDKNKLLLKIVFIPKAVCVHNGNHTIHHYKSEKLQKQDDPAKIWIKIRHILADSKLYFYHHNDIDSRRLELTIPVNFQLKKKLNSYELTFSFVHFYYFQFRVFNYF